MKKLIYKIGRVLIRLILPFLRVTEKNLNINKARSNLKNICEERELFNQYDIINLDIDENVDLSIVIPVYNVEKYLKKCLDSVVNQKTKYTYEIILVNDGSTDNSLKILKSYENCYHYIKVISQENQGLSGARNTGLNNSRGRYITFIDSDDCIKNGYIEKMMDKAIINDLDMVMCGIEQYDIANNKPLKIISHENILLKNGIGDEILNLKGFAWGKIYRRDLWNNVRFPVGYLFEDTIIRSVIMRMCNSFEFVDEPLYVYSIRKESLSRQNRKKRNDVKYLEQYFMQEKIIQLSEKIGLKKDEVLYKIMLYELGTCLWLRTRYLDENIKKCIFILSCNLIEKCKVDESNLMSEYQYLEKAFLKKNYFLWKLASLYIMLGVKCQNG